MVSMAGHNNEVERIGFYYYSFKQIKVRGQDSSPAFTVLQTSRQTVTIPLSQAL